MRVHTKQEMLEHALRESLAEGKWKPGDKIPSETELVQQYHVSRTLVRNVLATLIHDGLIESIHGLRGLQQGRQLRRGNHPLEFQHLVFRQVAPLLKLIPDTLLIRRGGLCGLSAFVFGTA